MSHSERVQLNLSIPKRYRSLLRRLAAQEILKDPDKPSSASKIAGQILTEYLSRLEAKEIREG